ncbi:HNH endonuclease [Streptomyces sp. NPDC048416]|uniref:HNH endonuclease n=1 Tax=Streptomyces sp. NPDC048416 TaxID=3365546 RepID=UPI00371B5CF0
MEPEDLYAAAVCWWSTAIAPAAKLAYWPESPLSVWTSFVAAQTPSARLSDALDCKELAPLTERRDVHSDRAFGSALLAAHRAHRAGHGTGAVLLTGSPFGRGRQRPSPISPLLEGPVRQAWDGDHYFLPTHWSHSAPAEPPPQVGVLWELSVGEWQRFEEDNAATFSRALHFVRHPVPTTAWQVRSHVPPDDAKWPHALATAYRWAFRHRPVLTCTAAADEKIFALRLAGQAARTALPGLGRSFVLRYRDHLLRIAGTLAAIEMNHIQGAHVDAAWSLVRRACLDTLALLQVPELTARALTAKMDEAIFGITETETSETPPLGESWRTRIRTRDTVRKSRDSSVVKRIKTWYHSCQMCGETMLLPSPERTYTEAAHIQPLKGSAPGPDVVENLLCLCANCHVRFDHGALVISDELTVIDTITDQELRALTVHPWHYINLEYVRFHREQWSIRTAAPGPSNLH